MKSLLILIITLLSLNSYAQYFKGADEFHSKIDSCYINNIRFSKDKGFYMKIDSSKYDYSINSDYIWEIHEEYHLGATFQIDSLKIEIKRIKENYWYYTEKLDSTYLIRGYFSINKSNYEIPLGNYDHEVYKEPFDIEDETRYFDTLFTMLKQGDWCEKRDEFDNIEHYRNNKKDGEFTLYNTKYSYILLSNKIYKENTVIKDSILFEYQIRNDKYFLGFWEREYTSYSKNVYFSFRKNNYKHMYFDSDYYHYNVGCSVGSPKPTKYIWKYIKKDNTLLLDGVLYKIIDSSEDRFVLVKIEKDD